MATVPEMESLLETCISCPILQLWLLSQFLTGTAPVPLVYKGRVYTVHYSCRAGSDQAVQYPVHWCERNYDHCKGFAWLVIPYLLQRWASVYFRLEGHDLPSSGFTSPGLISLQWSPSWCTSAFPRIKTSHAAVQERMFVKSNEHGKRELRYGCSPQEMDVIFLFDFGWEM